MATREVLNNGDTLGVIRGKINANFLEYDEKKVEASDVLVRGNTNPYSPTNPYNPATKGYVDYVFDSFKSTYDPGLILGNAFNRANHVGVMDPQYLQQDLNNRLVSDSQILVWSNAEPAIGIKYSAFNRNFGTINGTVAEGNHLHPTFYEPKNINIGIHLASTNNPHATTKAQVGLGNCDNTSDLNKPISTLTQTALNLKAPQTDVDLKRYLTNNTFGTVTDNTSFEADGTQLMTGAATVWDDDNLDPTQLAGGGTAPTAINFSTTTIKIASFVNAATDEVDGIRELPHKHKLGSPISFHAHWYPTTTNTGVCRFGLEYFFTQEGVAPTFPAIIYIEMAASGTVWAKQTSTFADITPPSELGVQFCFRFFRDGTHANDTFTGNAAVATIGYHYESDTLGSRQVNTK